MKTAMELALARIEMLYIEKDSVHWEMFKNDCMEKEKEQIIDFAMQMHKIDCSKTGTDILLDEAEQYYNQTYNQKK